MRICFVARNDFLSKPGGDTVQFEMYARAVERAGWQALTWFEDGPRPEADVYHAFNIDRPLEIYPRLRKVKEANRPFVVSTIHHPHEWMVRLRKTYPPAGLAGRLIYGSRLGESVAATETVKEVVRLAVQRRLGRVRDLFPGWSHRISWILANAARVFVLSKAETDALSTDFGFLQDDGRVVVLPNWVEGIEGRSAGMDRRGDDRGDAPVLVVGRIEARKNGLVVCHAARRVGRPVIFLGRPNPNESGYVAAFERAVKESGCVEWIRGVGREELGNFYGQASFLLNASLVEVSPLVDIEALSFGCPVATTIYALHHEYLPEGTRRIDPYDVEEIIRILEWYPQPGEPINVVSADSCRQTLLQTYEIVRAG